MRWLLCIALLGCSDELSFGRLRAPDAGACDVSGPLFPVAAPSCSGLRHALCSCGDYVSTGPTRSEGSLALGGLLTAGDLVIDGGLTIAGQQGAALTGDLTVTGALDNQGPLQGTVMVDVGGDARLAGDVRLQGLRVGGTLTLAEGAAFEITASDASPRRAKVSIAPPCDCTPTLDVGAQIERARDDDTVSQPELRTSDEARTLDLHCGRYYVEQLYAAAPLTLRVHDQVALYVGERIVTEAQAALTITLDADAQLDLFIRRGVTGAGPITITGGQARLYVGGDDAFFFAAPTRIEGTLYAPRSELVTQQSFELHGSALLARVVAEQLLTLRQTAASCR